VDRDRVVNTNNDDISFHDRTGYDKKVALLVADYINFVNELIKVAKNNGVSEAGIDVVLKKEVKSKHPTGVVRRYQDLLEGLFNIYKIVLKNDSNTIATD
jgi:NTE family protein